MEMSFEEQPLAAGVFLATVPALALPVLSVSLTAGVLVAEAEAEAEAAASAREGRHSVYASALAAVPLPLAYAGAAAVPAPPADAAAAIPDSSAGGPMCLTASAVATGWRCGLVAEWVAAGAQRPSHIVRKNSPTIRSFLGAACCCNSSP
jgi:hypothetical protein